MMIKTKGACISSNIDVVVFKIDDSNFESEITNYITNSKTLNIKHYNEIMLLINLEHLNLEYILFIDNDMMLPLTREQYAIFEINY